MSNTQPVDILPAVLPQSFDDLKERLTPLHRVVKVAQIDVVDGHFAKGKTWPYRDHATFDKIVADEHGLPFWDEIDFQFDLMIENPQERVMDFVHAGATQIVLHARSTGVLEALQRLIELRDEGGSFSVRAGIAIGPQDQPEMLEPFEAQFDFVQVMGIERIGRQGEPFDPHTAFLVERLRRRYPDLTIQVDGGVNKESIPSLVGAGANRLVVGSAIGEAEDPATAYRELTALAQS